MAWGERLTASLVLAWAPTALAGPPLVGDNPHTLGGGQLELIVAVIPVSGEKTAEWSAPLLDVTVGIVDGFDLAVSGAPVFTEGQSVRGSVSFGFKWQPLRTSTWNAAFSPNVDFSFSEDNDPINPTLGVVADTSIALPVQLEYGANRWAVGADLGYTVVVDGADSWITSLYGNVVVLDWLTLVAEFAALPTSSSKGTNLLLTGGFDWATPLGFNVLASGSGGFASTSDESLPWRAYLGLQWKGTLWGDR
jgi:hypothetical protein